MANQILNSDDVIDSRDIIARIEELESDLEDLDIDVKVHSDYVDEARGKLIAIRELGSEKEIEIAEYNLEDAIGEHRSACDAYAEWDGHDELHSLRELCDEASDYSSDWTYGEQLIRKSYFTEYVKELCEDCGDVPRNMPSYLVIDWDATADNIAVDYTEVEFDGVPYMIRCC